MTLTLYHCPETRSMRTLWLLNELGLAYELVTMPFDHKALRAPDYLAVHPLGRVPTLVDGALTVFESGAIAEYLCETYDREEGRDLGRRPGHPERPFWLQWIHFGETVVIPCTAMVQQYLFTPGEERSERVIYLETRRLGKCLDVIETVLGRHDYLLSGGFSAADISVGFSVHFATAFVSFDRHPCVKAYYERLRARPAFQKALPPGQPLAWLLPSVGPIRDPNTGKSG